MVYDVRQLGCWGDLNQAAAYAEHSSVVAVRSSVVADRFPVAADCFAVVADHLSDFAVSDRFGDSGFRVQETDDARIGRASVVSKSLGESAP